MGLSTAQRAKKAGMSVADYVKAAQKTGGKTTSLDTSASVMKEKAQVKAMLPTAKAEQTAKNADILAAAKAKDASKKAATQNAGAESVLNAIDKGASGASAQTIPQTEKKQGIMGDFMQGLKASVGLGEGKQYDPNSTMGKIASELQKANRMQVPMALMSAISIPSIQSPTKVSSLAKVGTSGVNKAATSTAAKAATNAKTAKLTTSWLQKLFTTSQTVTRTNPATGKATTQIITSTMSGKAMALSQAPTLLMGSIGSYPFAGFLKEEALQTLGFSLRSAVSSGNIEGAEEAIRLQEEMLTPDVWEKILNAIPFVNTMNSLKNFYKASRQKLEVDKKVVADMKTGESEDEKWARLRQEQEDSEKFIIDYYNRERKKMIEWELEAENKDMKEDAAYWRKEREKTAAAEKAAMEEAGRFWLEYKKEAQAITNG